MKQPIPVRVTSYNMTTKDIEDRANNKLINFRESADRKWLMNHMMWAFCNNTSVSITPDSN